MKYTDTIFSVYRDAFGSVPHLQNGHPFEIKCNFEDFSLPSTLVIPAFYVIPSLVQRYILYYTYYHCGDIRRHYAYFTIFQRTFCKHAQNDNHHLFILLLCFDHLFSTGKLNHNFFFSSLFPLHFLNLTASHFTLFFTF